MDIIRVPYSPPSRVSKAFFSKEIYVGDELIAIKKYLVDPRLVGLLESHPYTFKHEYEEEDELIPCLNELVKVTSYEYYKDLKDFNGKDYRKLTIHLYEDRVFYIRIIVKDSDLISLCEGNIDENDNQMLKLHKLFTWLYEKPLDI